MVQAPIQAMEAEHDLAGSILHEIRLETNHYQAPKMPARPTGYAMTN
jgi:iron-sulfur cluster repair protein YtfE (RIC family)